MTNAVTQFDPTKFDSAKIIPAPSDPSEWPAWRAALLMWRDSARERFGHDPSLYERPEFAWLESCFGVCLAMLCDETLFDPATNRFTPEAFLESAQCEFGGFDAVVLWHAYPNLGFDDRNQFDYYRDAPGGLSGLRTLSRTFRSLGVRTFVDYNPWDTGTRREAASDLETLADIVREIEADGVFLDTMRHGSAAFRVALDAARPGVALESESSLPLERVGDHPMSWAQWYTDSAAPGVLRNRFFEQRHVMHHTRRWERDHSPELQSAFMNGCGVLIWENVFGSFNGWNARDRALLRAMRPIQQRYAKLFSSGEWTPLVAQPAPQVYVSRWTLEGIDLWTLVNREAAMRDVTLDLELAFEKRFFDLVNGAELPHSKLSFPIRAQGIGAVVALEEGAVTAEFLAFLTAQHLESTRWSDDLSFPPLTRTRRASPVPQPLERVPAGMVAGYGGTFTLTSEFRNRECGVGFDAAFVNIWKPLPPDLHNLIAVTRTVTLEPFALDTAEVSNADFAAFIASSGYAPHDAHNFLAHWQGGAPPDDLEDAPVVWIDLSDARAYAAWASKRLPTEAEWQHGVVTHGLQVGRVWNWTESQCSDGRTRFCILKGGSSYRAEGSEWYADGGGRDPAFSAKFLLFHSGLDRQATVGFRCAGAFGSSL